MDASSRFEIEQPDSEWEAANPGWRDVSPDNPRWHPDRKDKNGNLAPPRQSASKQEETGLNIVNPVDLQEEVIPSREWIVEDWLPIGTVTANYGDGGTGKTLLAQQLMTSTALVKPWCGREVIQCRSFALFCEDDEAELHRRQAQINAQFGCRFSDLGNMRWVSGVGRDCTLVRFDNGTCTTPLWDVLVKEIKEFGAALVVIDTAADTYGGDENDRHEVRQFINVLTGLAVEIGGSVLLNAHPSRAGLASGNFDGGSTAWSNSVRSRWSLARPRAQDGQEEDHDARVLTRRKANYARIGEQIDLRWVNGLLVLPTTAVSASGGVHRRAATTVFLDLLAIRWTQGVFVSHSSRAGNYAPKIFAKCAERQGYGVREFEVAMNQLFDARSIRVETYGRRSDERQRIASTNQGLG
jgi:RecA-family ATPase